MNKNAVFAVGNILLGDDSAGQEVLKQLKGIDADLFDAGWGFNVSQLKKYKRVAIVDAGLFDGKPGDIKTCNLEEMEPQKSVSTHGIDIVYLLQLFKKELPEIKFFLIKPASGDQLSERVKKNIPKLARVVKEWVLR